MNSCRDCSKLGSRANLNATGRLSSAPLSGTSCSLCLSVLAQGTPRWCHEAGTSQHAESARVVRVRTGAI